MGGAAGSHLVRWASIFLICTMVAITFAPVVQGARYTIDGMTKRIYLQNIDGCQVKLRLMGGLSKYKGWYEVATRHHSALMRVLWDAGALKLSRLVAETYPDEWLHLLIELPEGDTLIIDSGCRFVAIFDTTRIESIEFALVDSPFSFNLYRSSEGAAFRIPSDAYWIKRESIEREGFFDCTMTLVCVRYPPDVFRVAHDEYDPSTMLPVSCAIPDSLFIVGVRR